jgi:hypothetical protein
MNGSTSDRASRSSRVGIVILSTLLLGMLLMNVSAALSAAHSHHRAGQQGTRQPSSQQHGARLCRTPHHSRDIAKDQQGHRRHHRADQRATRHICRAGHHGMKKGSINLDKVAPFISITKPTAGTTVSGIVVISGVAWDAQSIVRSIHVEIDDRTPRSVNPESSWTYSYDMSRLAPGQHRLIAFARDKVGNTGWTRLIITVAPPNPSPAPSPSPSPDPGPSPSPDPVPNPSPSPVPDPVPSPSPIPSPMPGTLPGPVPSGPGGGAFSINCAFDHRAGDDPIVFFGQPGAAHSHDFFGSTGVGASTTADQLRGHGTTCELSADTASYWAPSLVSPNGAVYQPSNILAYYRAPDSEAVRAFPHGLKIVAGVGGTQAWDPDLFGYSCSDQGPYLSVAMNCPSKLVLHVVFPSCWDGVNLDSSDHRSHMAYPVGAKCPADHPVKVVRLSLHVQYRGLTAGQGYLLAANPDGTRPGPHADFFNGWEQATLEHLVDICANAGQDVTGPCGQMSD